MHENFIRESHIWHDGNNMNLFIVVHWKQILNIAQKKKNEQRNFFMLLTMRITELFNIMHSAAEKIVFYLQSNFFGNENEAEKIEGNFLFFLRLKLLTIFLMLLWLNDFHLGNFNNILVDEKLKL